MSERDFSGRLPGPVTGRPRRPVSKRPSTVGGVDPLAELDLLGVEVDLADELGDGVGTHATAEVLAVAVLQLAPDDLVLNDLAGEEVLELVEGAAGQVDLLLGPVADLG